MPERRMKTRVVWEVLQNGVVVCSAEMGLTKAQAENKVSNEQRIGRGSGWDIRAVTVRMEEK